MANNKYDISLDDLDDEIKRSVKAQNDLEFTKKLVSSKFNKELSRYDSLKIEEKYVNFLNKFWLSETEQIAKSINPNKIVEFAEKLLVTVNSFEEFYQMLCTLPMQYMNVNKYLWSAWPALFAYSFLLKQLKQQSCKVQHDEQLYIRKFQQNCLGEMSNKCGFIQNEENFFKQLFNLLKNSKSPIDMFKEIGLITNVKANFENPGCFKEFLTRFLKCDLSNEYFEKAKEVAKALITQDSFDLNKNFIEVISSYFEPVIVSEPKEWQGRVLLEVSGTHMVLSKVIKEIEMKFKKCNKIVEEIHFVNAHVLHIDANLDATVWHGKNIAIYVETVIVSEDKAITWDVSGKHAAKPAGDSIAGTGEDGCGLAGADGLDGESGGNVLIMVDELRNGQNFTVISSGGNGSDGQDGGKGENGKEGFCLDRKSFKALFPPVASFFNSNKKEPLETTMNSVLQHFECVDEFSVGNSNIYTQSKTEFERLLSKQIAEMSNFYFKVRTSDGCKVTFSFYYGGHFERCQSFLLHEGSLGAEGKPGGKGGDQGKEGHAGDIEILLPQSNVITLRDSGKEGLQGQFGTDGNPGKSGVDKGYKDKTLSTYWPQFIPVNDENKKLKVSFQRKGTSEHIFCSHNNLYADIIEKEKEFNRTSTYRMKTHTKQINEHTSLHFEKHVQRKKTISKEMIETQYPQKNSTKHLFIDRNLTDELTSLVENSHISETETETESITNDIKVIKLAPYFQHSSFENTRHVDLTNYNVIEAPDNPLSGLTPSELVDIVKGDPSEINNWTQMLQVRFNISQMQDLWTTFQNIDSVGECFSEECIDQLKIGFCNKYQLSVVEDIANNVTGLRYGRMQETNSFKLSGITVNNYEDIFSKSDKEDAVTSGIFFSNDTPEARQFVLEKLNELFENPEDNMQILTVIFNKVFHEFGLISGSLLKDINKLEKKKEGLINTLFGAFKNALRREKDKSLFKELYTGIVAKDNMSLVTFENKTNSDKLLFRLYNLYVKEIQRPLSFEYVFNNPTTEDEIFELLYSILETSGPFNALYRELLSHFLETNILIYKINEQNQLTLTHNHNPRAKSSTHYLLNEDKLSLLDASSDFVEMYRSHSSRSRLLNDIFIQIDSFTEKEQFDNFSLKLSSTSNLFDDINTDSSLKIRFRFANILMQEININKILKAYHLDSQDSIGMLSRILDKLKHEYTGCETVLHILALHYESEGNHISAEELAYVIHFVLKCALNIPHLLPLVSWILATNSQTQWLVEIILLKLELHYKKLLDSKTKATWRKYLTKNNEKVILKLLMEKISEVDFNVSESHFEETIYLLSNIPNAHLGLDGLNFPEWKYYLKNKFWAHTLNRLVEWSDEDLCHASYYLVVLENIVGLELCEKLVGVIKEHKAELVNKPVRNMVLSIFRTITNKEVILNDKVLELLKNNNISDWEKEIEREYCSKEDRSLEKLVDLITNCGNTSPEIKDNLKEIMSTVEKSNAILKTLREQIKDETKLKEWLKVILKDNIGTQMSFKDKMVNYLQSFRITDQSFRDVCTSLIKNYQNPISLNDLNITSNKIETSTQKVMFETLFATVVLAVEIKNKIELREVQKLAIMTMLKSQKNALSQISTGEGKSFIIVVFSIVKVLWDEDKMDINTDSQGVDIITSSRVLAMRDAKDNKDVYNWFNINVGHNCSEDIEERKQSYSNNKVIYGDLANFQRDFLLDHVYDKNIIGSRSFNIIIIDEVDSMLLDKGNNTLYLSHEIPGLDKLEAILIYIWRFLHIPVESAQPQMEEIVSVLKNKILHDIFGTVTKGSLHCLDKALNDEEVNITWNFLMTKKIIDSCGNVLKSNIEDNFENLPDHCIPKSHLNYLFKKVNERETSLSVPNYLKPYILDHLEEWIKSGVRAMTMEPGVDYVVDIDRSESNCDRSPNITILDQDTGTDMTNSHWENGLHQLLQLKHGCRLSLISLKAVFISNVSYLKKYEHLYGLTGTLGSTVERDLLRTTYDVSFVTIPTAKTKSFTEEMPILCSSRETWLGTICKEVKEKSKNRSVLVVCESVNDVMSLKRKFKETLTAKEKYILLNIHTYTRDYEKLTVAENLEPGHIIISTNLAGRGTDIKLSQQLVDNRGLHVCLTYLPKNCRIEEQAFGRTARNGQPGSGQIIFQNSTHKTASTIIHLKQQRDIDEILRVADIKDYHKFHIQPEEECFKEFFKVYDSIKKLPNVQCENIKPILLKCSLDLWAFWLEKNSNCLNVESVRKITKNLSLLTKECIYEWVKIIKDPFQLVKLGLALVENKQYEKAVSLFDQVIEKEPLFSECAQYYRLFVKCNQEDVSKELIQEEMSVLANKLEERIKTSSLAAYTVDFLKKRNPSSLVQIESFKEQQLNVEKTYSLFLQSVHNIVGHEISFENFILPTFVDEETAFIVFNDLVEKGAILKPVVKKSITKDDFSFALEYGMSCEELCSVFKPIENERCDIREMCEHIKSTCMLPSREQFWSELLKKNILTNEKTYCIVDMIKLTNYDPSSINIVNQFKETVIEDENEIWLYQPKETGYSDNHCLVMEEILKGKVGNLKYSFFIDKSIINLNKLAAVHIPGDSITFEHFDSLKKEDFSIKLGISSDIALKIICELEQTRIIKEKLGNEEYMLLANNKDIENIVLSQYGAYSQDVIQLLKQCFSYQIAFKELCSFKAIKQGSGKQFCLPLQIRLEETMVKDLYEHKIVSKHVVNPEMNIEKVVKSLYATVFKDLYSSVTIKKINSINLKNIDEVPLPTELQPELETIKLGLQRQLNLQKKEVTMHILNVINNHQNTLNELENPTFTLSPLCKELQRHNLPTSEIGIFSLNGFENVLLISEKKYTLKMILLSSGVALFGIAEIAAGMLMEAFLLYPLIGAAFISEGISDIVYSVSCFYTGYFSWKDYAKHKAISLTITACLALKPLEIFKSVFGQKAVSPSSMFSSVTDTSLTMFEKVKDGFKSIFLKTTTTSTVDTAAVVATVAKQVVKQTAVGVSIGVCNVAVDNYLEPALEDLGKELVERMLGDIDEIDSHIMVNHIEEIYLLCGEKQTQDIVSLCYSKVLSDCNSKNKNNLILLLNKLTYVVNQAFPDCWQKLQSKGSLSTLDSSALFLQLLRTISKLNDIKNTWQGYSCVPKITSTLEKDLRRKINELKQKGTKSDDVNQNNQKPFTSKMIEKLKCEIKRELSQNISSLIVSPLLQNLKFVCAEQLIKSGAKTCPFNKKEELEELNKHNELAFKNIGLNHSDELVKKTSFHSKEYNEALLQIFKSKRSVPLYLEILKSSSSVDEFIVDLSCSVIPMALKIPTLRVIVEKNGNQHIYGEHCVNNDTLTIKLSPDEPFVTNISQNKTLLKNVLESIYQTIMKCCPQYKGLTSDILHKMLMSAVENDFYIHKCIKSHPNGNGDLNNDVVDEDSCNTKEKMQNIRTVDVNHQQSADHTITSTTDLASNIKLKNKKIFPNSQSAKKHVMKGFQAALIKINHHLHLKQPYLKSFKLTLEDFNETKHVIISNNEAGRYFDYCVTGYELVVPFTDSNNELLLDYTATMSFNSNKSLGSHIEYAVQPVDMNKSEHLDKSTRGHVILPFDNLEDTYGIDKCLIAGDLILPSTSFKYGTKKHKSKKEKNVTKKHGSKKKRKNTFNWGFSFNK